MLWLETCIYSQQTIIKMIELFDKLLNEFSF